MPARRLARPGYKAVHKRLYRAYGKAAAQVCVDCGSPARHWSYNGGCADELVEPTHGWPYCPHTEHYSARCVSCHATHDERRAAANAGYVKMMLARTHCDNGHEYTPENTRIRKDGSRACRACLRDYARAYRRRNKLSTST